MNLKLILIFNAFLGVLSRKIDNTVNSTKSSRFSAENSHSVNSYDELCQSQLMEFDGALAERKSWALQLFDTWIKVPAGYYAGNLEHMGNFDYCVEFRHETQSTGIIQGQHCFVTIQALPNSTLESETPLPDWREFANFIRQRNTRVHHGVCLPASCSTQMVTNYVNSKFLLKNDLVAVFARCRTNDVESLEIIDIFAAVFFSLIIFSLIASTCYDIVTRKRSIIQNKIFLSFSVYTNGKQLFEWSKIKSDTAINSLHGLRSLSIFWILIGHRFINQYPWGNPLDYQHYRTTASSTLIKAHHMAVDTFFCMGALLLTCSTLRECEREKLNIPRMIWRRYIRYTPALAALILFTLSLGKFLFTGPYIDTSYIDSCSKNWWMALLHIQNYLDFSDICLNHSWYLSNDFQLFLISPLLILLLHKFGKIMLALPAALLTISIIYIVSITLALDISYGTRDYVFWIYTSTQSRMGAWFIGMILGYSLHKHRGKVFQINSILNAILWVVSFSILLSMVLLLHIFYTNKEVPAIWNSIFFATFRNLWTVALCWIIFACQNLKTAGIVRWFLSLSFWQPFSRMGLSMYLSHPIYQVVSILNQRVPLYFNFWAIWGPLSGDILATIIISSLLYCAFEAPPLIIEDYVYKKLTKSKNK